MKTSIKQCISYSGLIVALIAILFCATGCAWLMTGGTTSRQSPDPLAGWKPDYTPRPSDKVIEEDYQEFIQQLTGNKSIYVPVQLYEDGTGQHAVRFEVFQKNKNASWHYVLIYDKDNKRIKVIKYGHSKYMM